ncbi:unnamed protein product [Sphenostylis stenocarpa]|uniref:adenylate kinase n=1 Tax=Sphenostylis stenocarpa TaxID=92480 RepID=A0AA86RYU7_9FABA|nr:unnamed protein product [Sphenostylis stenocarpa]
MAAIARLREAAAPLMALALRSNRGFGSAAAALCYHDDDVEEEEKCAPRGVLDAQGCTPERGVQWVMIGEPGARRNLFAQRLSKLLEVPHISMATLLSQDLNPRSSLYLQIAHALDHGKHVPEEIIFGLLKKRLEDGYSRGETGFILDGFPRTRIQAVSCFISSIKIVNCSKFSVLVTPTKCRDVSQEILDHIARVDLVVNFKSSEEELMKKNIGNRKFNSHQEYILMASSRHPTKQMPDDHVQSHTDECKLLEDYYRKQKKLLNFEVEGGHGETWQGLLAALHLQHINAFILHIS